MQYLNVNLSFTKNEAMKLKEARNLILSLCKEECDRWETLPRCFKESRMKKKADELDLDWNCIFIYEYEKRGLVK